MSDAHVEDRVRAILARTTGIRSDAAALPRDSPLARGGVALNSVALLHVIVAIEEEFGIVVDEARWTGGEFDTLATLTASIERELANAGR